MIPINLNVLGWKLKFAILFTIENLISDFLQSPMCKISIVELAQFFSKIIKQPGLSPLDIKYCYLILKLRVIFADQWVRVALINSSFVFKLNLALYTDLISKIVINYFAAFLMITWSLFNFISRFSYHKDQISWPYNIKLEIQRTTKFEF